MEINTSDAKNPCCRLSMFCFHALELWDNVEMMRACSPPPQSESTHDRIILLRVFFYSFVVLSVDSHTKVFCTGCQTPQEQHY